MKIHLVNPSELSFGTAVVTPRWMYVLAAATPRSYGDPLLTDETIEHFDPLTAQPDDVVGIGIHTGNTLRGYEVGRMARKRGATVIYGGVHPTLYPDEPRELGGAHSVVRGDGDVVWKQVLADHEAGRLERVYEAGRVDAESFQPARWDLLPRERYMCASVQTLRGCPKHCSFCSVWRTDGQEPRQRSADSVMKELVALRRLGVRYVALADDNFYPVTLEDLATADRRQDKQRLHELQAIRDERFELMARLAELPDDMVFFTQITMEASEDKEFLNAMRKAHIRGALVGVESVTPEGLKDVYKDFNSTGEELVVRLRAFKDAGVHLLGSFIFGLPSDRPDTFDMTADIAKRGGVTVAQFLMLQHLPGTVDFKKWEETIASEDRRIDGVPISKYWLIPDSKRPRIYGKHPSMSNNEIRALTQGVWDNFYQLSYIWKRTECIESLRSRLALVLVSKLFRQMYANTGLATDSARTKKSTRWARWLAKPFPRLFSASPMPDLQVPVAKPVAVPIIP